MQVLSWHTILLASDAQVLFVAAHNLMLVLEVFIVDGELYYTNVALKAESVIFLSKLCQISIQIDLTFI